MKKQGDTLPNEAIRRSKRGAGRLYKRDGSGKEHKADSDKHGVFWLEYRVNGKRIRQRLLDDKGNSIKTRRAAEKARAKILAPLAAAERVEQLKTIQEKLSTAETASFPYFCMAGVYGQHRKAGFRGSDLDGL